MKRLVIFMFVSALFLTVFRANDKLYGTVVGR